MRLARTVCGEFADDTQIRLNPVETGCLGGTGWHEGGTAVSAELGKLEPFATSKWMGAVHWMPNDRQKGCNFRARPNHFSAATATYPGPIPCGSVKTPERL